MNRWACMHDLNNYFRKLDLLGGLTETEKKQLKSNIGVVENIGDGGKQTPVEINCVNLLNLIKTKNLIPGVRYKVTDFLTIYEFNHLIHGKSDIPWELIVIANSNELLDSRITIVEHPDWIVEYDATPVKLSDGTFNKGTITYLKDSNCNSAYYDFKHIKFYRNGKLYYTFSDIVDGVIVDSSNLHNTKNNKIAENSINNVFIGDTYNNEILSGCNNNTFWKGCLNSVIGWDSINNNFGEVVRLVSGSIYNKTFKPGDTTLSTTITKTVLKVNEVDLISFLDPITYSYQVIII